MNQSTKKIKPLKELVGDRIFILPKRMANDVDIVTGKPCLFVGINGKATYVLVEEPTPISYNVFCALKDIGILDYYKTYEEGKQVG
jgi:hypothetical protein